MVSQLLYAAKHAGFFCRSNKSIQSGKINMEKNTLSVPYAMTVHGQEEIDAVLSVLKSSTQMGKHVKTMESKVAAIFEKSHGIMVNSGSSANYLAIEILDLPKGAEV